MTNIFFKYKWVFVVTFLVIFNNNVDAQARIIQIENPSFEGHPTQGGMTGRFHLQGWWDCGFKGHTPPDVHDGKPRIEELDSLKLVFGVDQQPFDGRTYLGMVVRSSNTYERVAQKLSSPIIAGQCYKFQIYLSRDIKYQSLIKEPSEDGKSKVSKEKFDFIDPCVLRIWGGSGYCNQKELLAESGEVINRDWMLYEFHFKAIQNHTHFELEAYYKAPFVYPYKGHILLDKAGNISPVPCPPEELLYTSIVKNPSYIEAQKEINLSKNEIAIVPRSNVIIDDQYSEAIIKLELPKEKILKELSKGKLIKGQKIKIEKLFFAADSINYDSTSEVVLDEIYGFLEENPNIVVEIGGHTNNQPKRAYCDSLSTCRAKNVYVYLIDKGVSKDRISFKGYGKSEPIASNKSVMGRRKNQRVEIKIISLNHYKK